VSGRFFFRGSLVKAEFKVELYLPMRDLIKEEWRNRDDPDGKKEHPYFADCTTLLLYTKPKKTKKKQAAPHLSILPNLSLQFKKLEVEFRNKNLEHFLDVSHSDTI